MKSISGKILKMLYLQNGLILKMPSSGVVCPRVGEAKNQEFLNLE